MKFHHVAPLLCLLAACKDPAPQCETAPRGATMLEPEFVRIEPGSFEMGTSLPDSFESPPMHVTLTRPFWMQTSEVSNAEFDRVLTWSWETHRYPSGYRNEKLEPCPECAFNHVYVFAIDYANARSLMEGYDLCYDDSPCHWDIITSDDLLTESTNGYQVVACTGTLEPIPDCTGYRLPTEAEWEYAARAGSTTLYVCGDDVGCLDAYAWHRENRRFRRPNPANEVPGPGGLLCPNAWGLYDMYGNALEWTSDVYTYVGWESEQTWPYHYGDNLIDPIRPFRDSYFDIMYPENAYARPSDDDPTPFRWARRSVRGGSVNTDPLNLRAFRATARSELEASGFRVVRTIFEE